MRRWLAAAMFTVFGADAAAQLPAHPENLQVLPRSLSTDSVFALMLGVVDALGVSCGHCHVGGDNATWDSTHFNSDAIAAKSIARAMFRLTSRLNGELRPATVSATATPAPVSCITCHRGAPRPISIPPKVSVITMCR